MTISFWFTKAACAAASKKIGLKSATDTVLHAAAGRVSFELLVDVDIVNADIVNGDGLHKAQPGRALHETACGFRLRKLCTTDRSISDLHAMSAAL